MEAEQSEEITILVLLNLVSSELAHLLCIVGIIMSPVNDMSQMPALGDPVSSPQVIDLIAEGDAAAEELYGPFLTDPDRVSSEDNNEEEDTEFVEEVREDVPAWTPPSTESAEGSPRAYEPAHFRYHGLLRWGGWKWTWYSERVLPGHALVIPGRHVDEDGYICDENDYICLASSSLARYIVVDTPFGKKGKVYDTGCAYDTLDVYVSW